MRASLLVKVLVGSALRNRQIRKSKREHAIQIDAATWAALIKSTSSKNNKPIIGQDVTGSPNESGLSRSTTFQVKSNSGLSLCITMDTHTSPVTITNLSRLDHIWALNNSLVFRRVLHKASVSSPAVDLKIFETLRNQHLELWVWHVTCIFAMWSAWCNYFLIRNLHFLHPWRHGNWRKTPGDLSGVSFLTW